MSRPLSSLAPLHLLHRCSSTPCNNPPPPNDDNRGSRPASRICEFITASALHLHCIFTASSAVLVDCSLSTSVRRVSRWSTPWKCLLLLQRRLDSVPHLIRRLVSRASQRVTPPTRRVRGSCLSALSHTLPHPHPSITLSPYHTQTAETGWCPPHTHTHTRTRRSHRVARGDLAHGRSQRRRARRRRRRRRHEVLRVRRDGPLRS